MKRVLLLPLALALVVTAGTAIGQQRNAETAAVPVRYLEGAVHGFLELRTAAGALLGHGDLIQIARDQEIESRMVFHFLDSSAFEETVTFTQQSVFSMETYHLLQAGPAFADDLDATLDRSGQYVVKTRSHKDGSEKTYNGRLDLPPDISNGMAITVAKNVAPGKPRTVHIVAFTPEPRLIGLEIAPFATERAMLGQHPETAIHYKLKPRLGASLRFFATLTGKAPPDSNVWIVIDDAPAFVRFEGPLYSGRVWRLELTRPELPK